METFSVEEHVKGLTLLVSVLSIKLKELKQITIVEVFVERLVIFTALSCVNSLKVDASLKNLSSVDFLFNTTGGD